VPQKLTEFQRMANFKAIMRFFRKFDQATAMRVFGRLVSLAFRQYSALTFHAGSGLNGDDAIRRAGGRGTGYTIHAYPNVILTIR
jgi:hypothetical protein